MDRVVFHNSRRSSGITSPLTRQRSHSSAEFRRHSDLPNSLASSSAAYSDDDDNHSLLDQDVLETPVILFNDITKSEQVCQQNFLF